MFTIRHVRRLSSATSSAISVSGATYKLRKEFDPDRALEIYSSVSKDHSSRVASRYALDLTVRRLVQSDRFSDIENLIESQKNDPKITQEPFLSTLIRSYGRAGMFDHALRIYDQMDEFGTPRSEFSFNVLLSAGNYSRVHDKVPQLFDEIPKKYGIVPNKVSYGILVKSYCEMGQPGKAIEIVKQLEEKGVEITVVTYTTILDALYKKGDSDAAQNLWNSMKNKGCIDAAAYNVRLMFAHGGTPEDVKSLMHEMTIAGFKPNTITYNYLMTCYLKCDLVKEAKEVYKGLKKNGCKANATTYRTLIYYLCKNGDFEGGYEIFKDSVKMHRIPDFSTMKSLAEGLVEKGKKEEAKELIRTIKTKFPPNMLKTWAKVEENLNLAAVEPDDAEEASA